VRLQEDDNNKGQVFISIWVDDLKKLEKKNFTEEIQCYINLGSDL